ncbi:4-hydroxy-tetrahydrodipicolinate synthase [Dirofilaria immitis]
MGRKNSNHNKRQVTNTSGKSYSKKQKPIKLCHRRKSSEITLKTIDDSTHFTHCFKKEKTENEQCYDQKKLMIRSDEDGLMKQIEIFLDSHPKCNFVQQTLQKLCDEGTMTKEMIAYFIDRSIRKRKEIQKKIDSLKNNQIKKSTDKNKQYKGTESSRKI